KPRRTGFPLEPIGLAEGGTRWRAMTGNLGEATAISLDHLVCGSKQRGRKANAARFGSLEVNHQLELGWLLDRQVARAGALQNTLCTDSRAYEQVGIVDAKARRAAGRGE